MFLAYGLDEIFYFPQYLGDYSSRDGVIVVFVHRERVLEAIRVLTDAVGAVTFCSEDFGNEDLVAIFFELLDSLEPYFLLPINLNHKVLIISLNL